MFFRNIAKRLPLDTFIQQLSCKYLGEYWQRLANVIECPMAWDPKPNLQKDVRGYWQHSEKFLTGFGNCLQ